MTSIRSASPAFTERDRDHRLYGPLPDVQVEAGYEADHLARVRCSSARCATTG